MAAKADDQDEMRTAIDELLRRWTIGAATGKWSPLIEMMTDDVEFVVPFGDYAGSNRGRVRAAQFFAEVGAALQTDITVRRVICSDGVAACEMSVRGTAYGKPFTQMLLLVLTIVDSMITSFHEFVAWPGGAEPELDLDAVWR